ncbi:hypothetical protein CDAR_493581 [Caerostris darwini]|uniref:Uncharacterized protein n=1 Tax=Caerostris darwini TaxID=1538125 RepID=A0AAV4VUG8_9ARAC|nr:hypothetical protein CDAR_493581 [Caerostris darwini]
MSEQNIPVHREIASRPDFSLQQRTRRFHTAASIEEAIIRALVRFPAFRNCAGRRPGNGDSRLICERIPNIYPFKDDLITSHSKIKADCG